MFHLKLADDRKGMVRDMFRVLVADDEEMIRQSFIHFVNWEELGCEVVAEAGNGREALDYLKGHPVDILITDIRMPEVDGIRLAQYVMENLPGTRVILLTAYADFSYAQTAIQYGVVDFVLKTNALARIAAPIEKAKQQILQMREKEAQLQKLTQEVEQKQEALFEKVICDALADMAEFSSCQNLYQDSPVFCQYYLLLCKLYLPAESQNDAERYRQAVSSLRELWQMAFPGDMSRTVLVRPRQLVALVPAEATREKLFEGCKSVLRAMYDFIGVTLNIGISGVHTGISELAMAYREAAEAGTAASEGKRINIYDGEKGTEADALAGTMAKADEIINSILMHCRHYKEKEALEGLDALFNCYRSCGLELENIRTSCAILCSLCLRLLVSGQCGSVPEDHGSWFARILEAGVASEMKEIMSGLLCHTMLSLGSRTQFSNPLIQEVDRYLRQNYTRDITLPMISEVVHANSSYLSRIYKKETGYSVIDALNRLRIEHAKELLQDPANRIFEVAVAVGIDSPTYFTHVFTKHAGVSPSKYRQDFLAGKNVFL